MEISLSQFPDFRRAFDEEEGEIHEDPLNQDADCGHGQCHAGRTEQCISRRLHIPAPIGLGSQSAGPGTEKAEIPVKQVEKQGPDGDSADEHCRIAVQMSRNGEVHHTDNRHGDAGQNAGHGKTEYFLVERGHRLSEFAVFLNHSQIGGIALGADSAILDRLLDSATRLVGMRAGGKAAVHRDFQHFREITGDFLLLQIYQAEAPEPGRVDDPAPCPEPVHLVQ